MFKPFNKETKIIEPLQESHKYVYIKSSDRELCDYITQINSNFWFSTSLVFDNDYSAFEKLDAHLQSQLLEILVFFAISEKAIQNNIEDNFHHDFACETIMRFLSAQKVQEQEHAETYSTTLRAICDGVERNLNELCDEHTVSKPVQDKVEWMEKWFSSDRSILERVAAMVCAEGILFQTSFAYISKLAMENVKMNGLIEANEYISRDEHLHCR